MISYGSQLATFKRQAIQYITGKTKEPGYKNNPELLRIYQSGNVVALLNGDYGKIEKGLEECSIERLCNIADKIHFQPLGERVAAPYREELPKLKQEDYTIKQSTDMAFEIKSNIPLPGQIFAESVRVEKKSASKSMNYRSLPLKNMKMGDCIIIHECTASTVSSKFQSAKTGIRLFVDLMDTKKKFKVAKTDDHKVGVWRVE